MLAVGYQNGFSEVYKPTSIFSVLGRTIKTQNYLYKIVTILFIMTYLVRYKINSK